MVLRNGAHSVLLSDTPAHLNLSLFTLNLIHYKDFFLNPEVAFEPTKCLMLKLLMNEWRCK